MDSWEWLRELERALTVELTPGDQVMYEGGFLNAHGVWVVHARLDNTYYTLRHPENSWERLNADRTDLTPVEEA